MTKFLVGSYQKCYLSGHSWSLILANIEKQMSMRALSCVQLASKLMNKEKRLKPEQILEALAQIDTHTYCSATIRNSEVTVLQTVNFIVKRPTPIVIIELFLELLGYNIKIPNIELEYLLDQSEVILDLVMLNQEKIIRQLCSELLMNAKICSSEEEVDALWDKLQPSLKQIQADNVLLASAVTLVAGRTYADTLECENLADGFPQNLVSHLALYSNLPKDHILPLAKIIYSVCCE